MSTTPTQFAGNLFLISAPSGAGKSSLVNALLKQESGIQLSISYTTRTPRPGEENGREYHFISIDEFLSKQNRGDFLECAEVHGNFYGTSRLLIEDAMRAGTDILLEIDWQGAQQVRKQFADVLSIFILPPSVEELQNRLRKRGQDNEEVIKRRILAATGEMAHAPEYEYVIINQNFDVALSELVAIIKAARCRTVSQFLKNNSIFEQSGINYHPLLTASK